MMKCYAVIFRLLPPRDRGLEDDRQWDSKLCIGKEKVKRACFFLKPYLI